MTLLSFPSGHPEANGLGRRSFLRSGLLGAGALALSSPFTALGDRGPDRGQHPRGLLPVRAEHPGQLAAGGRLEMLKVAEVHRASLRGAVGTGATFDVEWVPIADPDPATGSGVRNQGLALGAAEFARPEGAWVGNGLVYFACTSGGAAGQGQIFAYDPVASTLTCVFESPNAATLNAPDNICVSPRGGIVIGEDGSGSEFLQGLSLDGESFPFDMNNADLRSTPVNGFAGDYSGSEWAGACFDTGNGGNWLFANLQSPGITFAITGPWRQGAL